MPPWRFAWSIRSWSPVEIRSMCFLKSSYAWPFQNEPTSFTLSSRLCFTSPIVCSNASQPSAALSTSAGRPATTTSLTIVVQSGMAPPPVTCPLVVVLSLGLVAEDLLHLVGRHPVALLGVLDVRRHLPDLVRCVEPGLDSVEDRGVLLGELVGPVERTEH